MRVGLFGYPVAHSASPKMHNAAFAALGFSDWTYELWETAPADLAARIQALRDNNGIAGANVTIPHKQAVVGCLDALTAHARAIGAVNTIIRDGCDLIGDNTDAIGFIDDLRIHGVSSLKGMRALVLGAGGSARAICYGLLEAGANARVFNRDFGRASNLCGTLKGPDGRSPVAVEHIDAQAAATADLIVNCTSAGMDPNPATTPWPVAVPFPASAILYDLVYKPAVTTLMRDAGTRGARVIGGLGMLAEQGAEAFARWTGRGAREASVIMRQTLGVSPV
ncbi:MAG: shikimate dehydrogenase [Thermoflexales bacterium]